MKLKADKAVAIAIDYQERLMPAMSNQTRLLEKSVCLLKGLKLLGVPTILTQQNTKGLGMSVQEIYDAAGTREYMDKMAFSICSDEAIKEAVEKPGREQVILCGVEAHICVLQTAIDLKAAGYEPVIVTDCISSRREEDKQTAVYRAMQEGILVTTCEALLFELLGKAGSDTAKAILRLVK